MTHKPTKILSIILSCLLVFQQTGFAQAAAVELNLSGYFARMAGSLGVATFRPLHLRYLGYDPAANNFNLLLDKGDFVKGLSPRTAITKKDKGTVPDEILQRETKTLLNYFFIGISLPNSSFWVNLRPDSPDNIIDPELAQTDIGKIFLEADLQLKKDTALYTSPQTPEGREYWEKLYKKAEELYGNANITIPTLTRPWIVPDEIIIRESSDNAYIYKATLKVMLEQDYLKDSSTYSFPDQRSKALNEYSSQLVRETIIPKLTKEINSSERYAPLRQVYYSLVLAQWFKLKFKQGLSPKGTVPALINSHNLTNLVSKEDWDKTTYFNAYKQSFQEGEYNIKEPVYTPSGQVIRSYMSGGIEFYHTISSAITKNLIHASMQQKSPAEFLQSHNIGVQVAGSPLADNPEQIEISFTGKPGISTPSALDSVPASQPQNQAKPGKEQEIVTSASPVPHTAEGSPVDKDSNRENVNFLNQFKRAILKPATKIAGLMVLCSTLIILPFFYGDVPIIGDALTIMNKIHFNIARYIPMTSHGSLPQQISNDQYFQKITRSMSKASKHSIGSCIYRLLKRSALELNPENIKKAGELIINMRDSVASQEVFSASRKVINITHANVNFDLNSMASLESEAGTSNISSFKGGKDKQAALNEIADSKGALTIYFSGHGGKKHFWLVNSIVQGRERANDMDSPAGISYQELGDALIKKGDLAGTKIIFDACYSYNYAVNLLERLTDSGTKDLPILIGADNFNRLGFGEAFYMPVKNAYQKHRGPLIMQDIFDAEEEGSVLQDYVVFIPIDQESLPRDFIPALSTGRIIELDWNGLNGVIGIPTGALEISRSDPVNTDDGKLASVSLSNNTVSSSAIKDAIPRGESGASAAASPASSNVNSGTTTDEVKKVLISFINNSDAGEKVIYQFPDSTPPLTKDSLWWKENRQIFHSTIFNYLNSIPVGFKGDSDWDIWGTNELQITIGEILNNEYAAIASFYYSDLFSHPPRDYKGIITISLSIEDSINKGEELVITVIGNGAGKKSIDTFGKRGFKDLLPGGRGTGLSNIDKLARHFGGRFEFRIVSENDELNRTIATFRIPLKSLKIRDVVLRNKELSSTAGSPVTEERDEHVTKPLIAPQEKIIGNIVTKNGDKLYMRQGQKDDRISIVFYGTLDRGALNNPVGFVDINTQENLLNYIYINKEFRGNNYSGDILDAVLAKMEEGILTGQKASFAKAYIRNPLMVKPLEERGFDYIEDPRINIEVTIPEERASGKIPIFTKDPHDRMVIEKQISDDPEWRDTFELTDKLEGRKCTIFATYIHYFGSASPLTTVSVNQQGKSDDIGESATKTGGIDMRELPKYTKVEQMGAGSPIANRALHQEQPLSGAVPISDKEWQEIERMANSGITPSCERIREYLLSLKDPNSQIDKVLACIADILRQEEEKACCTEPSLKEILVLLESGKPAGELKLALTKVEVLAQESQLIGQ